MLLSLVPILSLTAFGAEECTHNNMSGWESLDDTQHYRYCEDCNSEDSYEYENHTVGDGCEDCGYQYDSPDSPQTGDNSNLWLWFALLYISGSAIITLTIVDRKRRSTVKR